MPKVTSAGLYPRHYDLLSDDSPDEIASVLAWTQGMGPAKKADKKSLLNMSFLDQVGSAVSNGFESLRNVFSGRKIKSSLLTLGAIGLGAGAGFVLGTFVLPGIGSAIGGAVGGFLTAGAAMLGGSLGLGALGATIGGWFGPKASKTLFKGEYQELSKKQMRKLTKMGIDSQTVDLMNDYLNNRENSVKSELCKRSYQALRKAALQNAQPDGIENTARFFCHELVLLGKEMEIGKENQALLVEIEYVRGILNNLAKAHQLSYDTRSYILKTNKEYDENQNKLKASVGETPELKSKLENDNQASKQIQAENTQLPRQKAMQFTPAPESKHPREIGLLSVEQLDRIEKRVKKTLDQDYIIKKIKSEPNLQNPGVVDYRYRVRRLDNSQLAEIRLHEQMVSDKHSMAQLLVDRRMSGNVDEIAHVMAVQSKAYLHKASHAVLTVVAGKNDALAISFMAAALSQGLSPQLDEEEYPENTLEEKAKKEKIIQEAYTLANLSPPPKKSKMGFKMEIPKPK